MTHSQILEQIKKGDYAPIYFLQSEEPYFVDLIVESIEKNVLSEAEKSFNEVIMYGKESTARQILDQAVQFPMMAPYRTVIVKEAQELKDIDELTGYIENPAKQTLLVLAFKHKKFDKRKKKLWSAIKKNAVILDSKRLYDNQVPAYIQMIASDNGLKIDQNATRLLTEYLGSDLSKIANELNKLALVLDKSEIVTAEHIDRYIGINKDYNIFELQKAIGEKNKAKAYRIVRHFASNEKSNPMPRNVASLYNYFSKLFIAKKYQRSDSKTLASKLKVHPYFSEEYRTASKSFSVDQLGQAFHYLHIMDRHSKGIDAKNADSLGLYQEFLFKLFAA